MLSFYWDVEIATGPVKYLFNYVYYKAIQKKREAAPVLPLRCSFVCRFATAFLTVSLKALQNVNNTVAAKTRYVRL